MSQQKDSDQGAERDEPTAPAADAPTRELDTPAGQDADATSLAAGSPDTGEADTAGEPGIVTGESSDEPAAPDAAKADSEAIDTEATDPEIGSTAKESDSTTEVAAPAGKRSPGAPEPVPASGLHRSVTLGSIALLVVAAIAALGFGGVWIVGGLLRDKPRADARDAALADAQQAAINLMSFNPDDVDGSLKIMISSTTGELHDEQTKDLDSLKQQVTDAKTRMESTVEGAALTSLNSELDHASAYVVLHITRSWPGGQPATFLQSWSLDMVKVGDVWKAEKAQNLGNPITLNSGTQTPATPAPTAAPTTPKPGN